jgi:bifunctional DNA-binding transcriptional regulator/antitoxin component of YhaV-PrlF toxin-antitoxin module
MEMPAEARRALGIVAGDEMAVLRSGNGHVMLVRADMVREFVRQGLEELAQAERQLRADGLWTEALCPAATPEDDGG